MNTLFFVDYAALAKLKANENAVIEKCNSFGNPFGVWYASHPNIAFCDYKELQTPTAKYITITVACVKQGFDLIDAIFTRLAASNKCGLDLKIRCEIFEGDVPCWKISFTSAAEQSLAQLNAIWELLMIHNLPVWHPLIKKGNVNHG